MTYASNPRPTTSADRRHNATMGYAAEGGVWLQTRPFQSPATPAQALRISINAVLFVRHVNEILTIPMFMLCSRTKSLWQGAPWGCEATTRYKCTGLLFFWLFDLATTGTMVVGGNARGGTLGYL